MCKHDDCVAITQVRGGRDAERGVRKEVGRKERGNEASDGSRDSSCRLRSRGKEREKISRDRATSVTALTARFVVERPGEREVVCAKEKGGITARVLHCFIQAQPTYMKATTCKAGDFRPLMYRQFALASSLKTRPIVMKPSALWSHLTIK
jgi:hypothetical protein